MNLSPAQLEKLSDLCLDLAKGMFLASLAAPAISSAITLVISLRIFITGLFLTYLSLKIVEIREVKR